MSDFIRKNSLTVKAQRASMVAPRSRSTGFPKTEPQSLIPYNRLSSSEVDS